MGCSQSSAADSASSPTSVPVSSQGSKNAPPPLPEPSDGGFKSGEGDVTSGVFQKVYRIEGDKVILYVYATFIESKFHVR